MAACGTPGELRDPDGRNKVISNYRRLLSVGETNLTLLNISWFVGLLECRIAINETCNHTPSGVHGTYYSMPHAYHTRTITIGSLVNGWHRVVYVAARGSRSFVVL